MELSAFKQTLSSAVSTNFLAPIIVLVLVALVSWLYLSRDRHPLHEIPGPWLNSFSHIPSTISLIRGRQHIYFYQLHSKFGPVVRVAPNEVSFTNACDWQDVYGTHHGYGLEKPPAWVGFTSKQPSGEASVGHAEGREHARQRRALMAGFTFNAVQTQKGVLFFLFQKALAKLEEASSSGRPVNTAIWMMALTFDVIGEFYLSQTWGCLDDSETMNWAASQPFVLKSGIYEQSIRTLLGQFGKDNPLQRLCCRLIPGSVAVARRQHGEKTKDVVQKRLAKSERVRGDALSQILARSDGSRDDKALSPTEIMLNSGVLIPGGSETSAIAMTAWTYLICTHRDCYQRLIKEIREAFPNGCDKDIDLDKIMGLHYLHATFREAMRLFQPVATTQRRITSTGGASIDGQYIPARTIVGVAQWAANRLPTNFYEPNSFHPERWLAENQDLRFANDSLSASQPFGIGPRICLGQKLAEVETRMFATLLILNFDLAPADLDQKAWSLEPDAASNTAYHTLARRDYLVQLTPRKQE